MCVSKNNLDLLSANPPPLTLVQWVTRARMQIQIQIRYHGHQNEKK